MRNNFTLIQRTLVNQNNFKFAIGGACLKPLVHNPTVSNDQGHIHTVPNDVAGPAFTPINQEDFIDTDRIEYTKEDYTIEEVEYICDSLRITAKTVEYVSKTLAEIEGIEYSTKLRERVWREFREQHK